jgi:hypothetical protein
MCRTDAWPSRLTLCFFECLCLSRLLSARCGYQHLIHDSIGDNIFTLSPYRPFETKADKWIKQNYPTYANQFRPVEILLLNENPWQAGKNKLLYLCNESSQNKEYYTFYHGCSEKSVHSICLNGL